MDGEIQGGAVLKRRVSGKDKEMERSGRVEERLIPIPLVCRHSTRYEITCPLLITLKARIR